MMQGAESSYQEYLAKGEFRIQRCDDCSSHIFYPRFLCPDCGSSNLSWIKPSGAGTVYSTTVMRRRAEAGGDYNVCLVQLNEGPRLMSRIEGVAPTEVRIGMAVTARVAQSGEDGFFVVFDAAGN
ncbi:MAG: DNA-binding protein [Betaproteobacteria bacterium RIFCSPLOWO2_02_FULL_62_17]|nr:MAG: DNA-binding protein [Betaproteobacteria bacterium RIFCSPLOWO2_02_FULL_62_17]